ncbi:hypothetical protein JCM10207_003763 [Rhodosporidiobolus poonsookiae]
MPHSPADSIELAVPTPALARTPAALSRSSSYGSLDSKHTITDTPLAHLGDLSRLSTLPGGPGSPVEEEPAQRMRRLSMGDEDHEGAELRPVDKGRGAWTFVVAGFFLETFIWGFSYSFPSVLVWLQRNDPWQSSSLAALSAIGTVLLAIQFIIPIVFMNAFRRYPDWIKPMLWISLVINCGSMLIASWATKVWQLILLIGVLGGISGAVLYAPVLLWLNSWFHMKRGLASGIVFAGTGIGGLAFPFLLSALLRHGGFPLMCRAWAGITAGVYAVSVYFIEPRVPLPRRVAKGNRAPWFGGAGDLSFLKDPVVVAMTLTTLIFSLSTFPVTLYLPTYALSLASPSSSDLVVSIYNLAASVGSTVVGYLTDVSLPLTVGVMGVGGAVLAFTAWGFANSLGTVFAFAVLFSLFTQICSAWGAAARDAAGTNPHTSTLVFCVFGIVRGVASIVGPFISTTLYDPKVASGDDPAWGRFGFANVIVFVGVLSFVGALGGPALWWAKRLSAKRRAAGRG